MGCGGSSIYEEYPNIAPYKPLFHSLRLSNADVMKLFKNFIKIDKDHSGTINIKEMLTFLDLESSPFNKRIFSCFDENDSGSIDFREYVIALWNYLTCGSATLDMFTFDLYDRDNSGFISYDEVEKMCAEIFGSKWLGNKHARSVVAEMKHRYSDDGVNIAGFHKFAKTHAMLFLPTFEVQRKMREKICGAAFWDTLSKKRISLTKDFVIPIAEFKKLLTDPDHMNVVIASLGNDMSQRGFEVINNTGLAAARHHHDDCDEGLPEYHPPDRNHKKVVPKKVVPSGRKGGGEKLN